MKSLLPNDLAYRCSEAPGEKKAINWEDDILSDSVIVSHTLSVDLARKLLQTNPAMREKGIDTDFIVNQAGRVQPTTTSVQKSSQKIERDRKNELSSTQDADHLFELAEQQYEQERQELETQLFKLKQRLTRLKTHYLHATIDQLLHLDSDLSSLVTKEAIQTHRRFLDNLGFTLTGFVERLRQCR